MNFNLGHFWVIFGQNTKVIALLFGQKWLILITFQSAIKMNEFQFWSLLGDFWAKYQVFVVLRSYLICIHVVVVEREISLHAARKRAYLFLSETLQLDPR